MPLHDTKLLFHRGGAARSVTVLSLAFLFMLAPSCPPSFPLHFWLVPIDRVWGREERGDTLFLLFCIAGQMKSAFLVDANECIFNRLMKLCGEE